MNSGSKGIICWIRRRSMRTFLCFALLLFSQIPASTEAFAARHHEQQDFFQERMNQAQSAAQQQNNGNGNNAANTGNNNSSFADLFQSIIQQLQQLIQQLVQQIQQILQQLTQGTTGAGGSSSSSGSSSGVASSSGSSTSSSTSSSSGIASSSGTISSTSSSSGATSSSSGVVAGSSSSGTISASSGGASTGSGSGAASSSSGTTSSSTSSSSGISSTNGACGSANGGTFSAAPTTNLCSAGTPTAVTTDGSSFIWQCVGTNTGDADGCFATKSSSTGSSGGTCLLNKGSSLNAPAPAAAAGYTVQTFGPSITLGTTPDPTTSYPQFTNGANWVPFAFLGTEWTNIGVVQNSDGSITLNGAGEIYGNGVTTAVPPGSAGNTSWQGIAFGGGGYFEATMAFNGPASFWANDFESMGYSSAGDLTERQWPGQAAGYGDWIETDFAEFDTTNAYGFAMHNWYGTPDNPQGTSTLGSGSTVTPGGPLGPPAGTDYTQPHKYGFLWVPATATTQGYARWYL